MGGVSVTIEWGGYEPYVPIVRQPLGEVPRKEARAEFKKLMSEKEQRIAALTELLRVNGLELSATDEGLQDLNDWFVKEVERDSDHPERLLSRWYGVVNDMALFVGDVMISRYPNLKWVMYEWGAKNMSYHRHVIMGFTNVANPKYNVDVDILIATIGHRAIKGLEVDPQYFVRLLREAQKNA